MAPSLSNDINAEGRVIDAEDKIVTYFHPVESSSSPSRHFWYRFPSLTRGTQHDHHAERNLTVDSDADLGLLAK